MNDIGGEVRACTPCLTSIEQRNRKRDLVTDQGLRDELATLTCDLIAIPSVAEQPAQLGAVIDYAERYARAIPGVRVKRFEWAGKPSLVATLRDTTSPAFMLNAHLDVVPARTEQF